ncbi:hypothetical protein MRX96_016313 [Rhipicephalus microplus]
MASSCHNVIDDCVKRCANRENHTSEPSLERTDDTDPSGGSHLKKREQHSGRNLPGLPPDAQGKEAVSQTMPSAELLPVPQTAEVASPASATIPKTLQSIKVCEVRLNGSTVAQPSILPSKDAAAASPVCLPQQALLSTSSLALCLPASGTDCCASEGQKDGEKKKRSTKSSNSSKSGSKSHSSNSGEGCLEVREESKKADSSDRTDRKERRKKHKHREDEELHSAKCTSKEGSKHTEPPEKKLKISSNTAAKSSGHSSSKKDQLPHKTKPPPAPPPTTTPCITIAPPHPHSHHQPPIVNATILSTFVIPADDFTCQELQQR